MGWQHFPPGEQQMAKAGIWCGALVLVDGVTEGMVQQARDGEPVLVIARDGTRQVQLVDAARLTVEPLPAGCWTHSVCGAVIRQHGNRTSHCPSCHRTFEGHALADAHRRMGADGEWVCLDPAHMRYQGARVRLVDGSWRGPKLEAGAFA